MIDHYKRLSKKLVLDPLFSCETGYMDAEDCSWYHQNWITLRQLGLVSNPFWHEQFFVEMIKKHYSPSIKVLVLGTADFSMPLLCATAGVSNLAITDICQTPLNICNEIANIEGYDWRTYRCNIYNGLPEKYDIIIDDAFLTRFNYPDKTRVLSQIKEALLPFGRYITTIRQGWNSAKAVIPSKYEQANFVEKAKNRAIMENINTAKVEMIAPLYISKMASYPIPNEQALYKLCEDGMVIEYISKTRVPGECSETTYFEVVFLRD